MSRRLRAALLSASLLSSTVAVAQSQSEQGSEVSGAQAGTLGKAGANQQTPQTPDALLGNWGGLRTMLDDAGVKLSIGYKGEAAGNVSGGGRHYATETGQLAFTAAFDTQKIVGLEGGTVQTTVSFRHGHDLGERAGLNLLQQPQEVYGRGQTWRLTEFWYQQVLAGGSVVLKAGRVPAGDFATFDCDFQNLTFCGSQVGNLAGYYWFNYPIAQWTGWAKFRRGDYYLKLGVNEDNRNNLDNAFFISRGGASGVIGHVEAGWTPNFAGGKLPGLYKAGWFITTAKDPDVLRDIHGNPYALSGLAARNIRNQYGFYVQGQQQITGEAAEDPISGVMTRKRGLNLFFNVTRIDPVTAPTILDQETIGLYVNKPFASRPDDQLGFALGRSHFNGRAARTLVIAMPGADRPTSEYPIELYYGFHAIRGVVLRPNLQYVFNPGGYRRSTDVAIIGGRFDVSF